MKKRLFSAIFLLGVFFSQTVHATSLNGGITSSNISQKSIWEIFGFSKQFGTKVADFFGYQSLMSSLQSFNFLLTLVFFIAIVSLMFSIAKILKYVNRDNHQGLVNPLKLVPLIMDKNTFEFFDQYCKRNPDGTFECSYTEHLRLQKMGKVSLHSAFLTIGLKISVLLLLFAVNSGYLSAYTGRSSSNYQIFIDSQLQGGGALTSSLSGYGMTASVGDAIASDQTTSNNYQESSGALGIEDEPSVGLTWGNASGLNFGIIDNQSTTYGTHTITLHYNGNAGMDLMLFGTPPTNENDYVIDAIGSTAVSSAPGTEQFGINLVGNTVPANVGADVSPIGSPMQATSQYNQANKYAWGYGDIIATSTERISETIFTVTVIMNIDSTTPSGSYVTNLNYSVVPRF